MRIQHFLAFGPFAWLIETPVRTVPRAPVVNQLDAQLRHVQLLHDARVRVERDAAARLGEVAQDRDTFGAVEILV